MLSGDPVPDEDVLVASSGDEDVWLGRGNGHLTDKLLVAEAKVLNDVRVGNVAGYADMLISVGCEDIPAALLLAEDEGGQHGDVSQQQVELEIGTCRVGGLGFGGELGLLDLVEEGEAVAFGVDGEGGGSGLEGLLGGQGER